MSVLPKTRHDQCCVSYMIVNPEKLSDSYVTSIMPCKEAIDNFRKLMSTDGDLKHQIEVQKLTVCEKNLSTNESVKKSFDAAFGITTALTLVQVYSYPGHLRVDDGFSHRAHYPRDVPYYGENGS